MEDDICNNGNEKNDNAESQENITIKNNEISSK